MKLTKAQVKAMKIENVMRGYKFPAQIKEGIAQEENEAKTLANESRARINRHTCHVIRRRKENE